MRRIIILIALWGMMTFVGCSNNDDNSDRTPCETCTFITFSKVFDDITNTTKVKITYNDKIHVVRMNEGVKFEDITCENILTKVQADFE